MRAPAAFALSVLATAPAIGADFPVLRGSFVPATAPVTADWSGFYVGGSFGYLTSNIDPWQQAKTLESLAHTNTTIADATKDFFYLPRVANDALRPNLFFGYNMVFDDAVVGIEADYTVARLSKTSINTITRVDQDLFPTETPTSPGVEATSTTTTTTISGSSATSLKDFATIKGRFGYAFGNFMPFGTFGLAVGRFSNVASVSQASQTIENQNLYNIITTVDPISGAVTYSRGLPLGTGTRVLSATNGTASNNSRGYNVGLAFGAGVDALLMNNVFLRFEYQRIMFAAYKDVKVTTDMFRAGAGVKF